MNTTKPSPENEETMAILVDQLNSSLEPNLIIEQFFKLLKARKLADGLIYKNLELNISQHIGQLSKHECNHEIESGETKLGYLSISRKKKYTHEEQSKLQRALFFIKNPLRNAFLHRKAIHAAIHDPLTKLYNRSTLAESLSREINRSNRYQKPLSILLIDLDDFKKVNDRFGHLVGDKILRFVAATVLDTLRETDIGFRIGGEEFLIILPNTNEIGGKILAERLRRKIEQSKSNNDKNKPNITASIGFAVYHSDESIGQFFSRADKALYSAKKKGKNTVITA